MSEPNFGEFRAKVIRDPARATDWRVEKLEKDGVSVEVTIFSRGDARQRAIRYAAEEYGAFDEVALEDCEP